MRFALERHPFCHHPASTYYMLGTVPEVGNAKVPQTQPLFSTTQQRSDPTFQSAEGESMRCELDPDQGKKVEGGLLDFP